MTSSLQTGDRDYTLQNFNRLLHRLHQNVLIPPDSDHHIKGLCKSEYQRNRVSTNIECARTLLLRLEHSSYVDNNGKRSCPSTSHLDRSLREKRTLLRRIQRRLDDLSHQPDNGSNKEDNSGAPADEDTTQLLERYAPSTDFKPSNVTSQPSMKHSTPDMSSNVDENSTGPATHEVTLRQRHRSADTTPSNAPGRGTTSSSTPLLPDTQALFPSKKDHSTEDTAQLLESHDSTQTALTDSLLLLASALKASSQQFSDSLDASTPLVDMAAQALDKNVTGMQNTAGKMGELRRKTSGWGWFMTLGLWARVGVLWVVLVLVVFVMPKLRF